MSNKDDFNSKLDVLKAIPNEEVQTPSLPVDVFLQEAENLYQWSMVDQNELAVIGIAVKDLKDLQVRTGALREAQSVWYKELNSQAEAQREWAERSPVAYNLRDELVHTFRFAYRNTPSVLSRVSAIAEGSSHADMIQDLNDLAVLGRANINELDKIGVALTQLDDAATLSDEMADVLAKANGDKGEQSESKDLRDRAYTHLKERVDDIREAGKYLFWRNPNRLKGYVSQYWRKQSSSTAKKTEETTD